MIPDTFDELSPQERDELALCGITSPTQLQNSSANRIMQDLEKAREFFPDKSFTLTGTRVNEIFSLYENFSTRPIINEEELEHLPKPKRSLPTVGYKHHSGSKKEKSLTTSKKRTEPQHSPVRCSHPFLTVFAALSTLILLVPIASIVVFPWLMLTNNMPNMPVEHLAALIFGIPCLLYIFIAYSATCPVCHMRIFRFSHYTRNRAAHHLPILGYNFTTALHMLLFWRYNCPGCGTPVRLIGRKGRKTHC